MTRRHQRSKCQFHGWQIKSLVRKMGTLNVFVTSSNKMIILSNYVYSTFFTCTTDSLSFSFIYFFFYNKEMTEYDTLVYEMHSLLCFYSLRHIINVTNTMFYFSRWQHQKYCQQACSCQSLDQRKMLKVHLHPSPTRTLMTLRNKQVRMLCN